MYIELVFPVLGESIPIDHGYALYSALSRVVPELHSQDNGIAVSSISGQYIGAGKKQLRRGSSLRFRLPGDAIAKVLPLSGRIISIEDAKVQLGVPRVQALTPAANLIARIVTIKGYTESVGFLDAARIQLLGRVASGEPSVPLIEHGPHAGRTRRKVLRVRDCRVGGLSLLVTGLTYDDSLVLQRVGLGGLRKMGCGICVTTQSDQRHIRPGKQRL